MKTRTVGYVVIFAVALIATWSIIGRYDLALIVAIGNLPVTALLLYKLWRKAP